MTERIRMLRTADTIVFAAGIAHIDAYAHRA